MSTQHDPTLTKIENITIPTVDDVVDYRIYIFPLPTSISVYKQRLDQILDYVQNEIIKDYIWQDEPFLLTLIEGLESSSLEPATPCAKDDALHVQACHFFGSTRFGDNIEDEWFVVHILQRLSEKFEDLYIRYEVVAPFPSLRSALFVAN